MNIVQNCGGLNKDGDFEKMMRDYIDKLWTEIVKGSDGKTSELRNDIKWLVDFFHENYTKSSLLKDSKRI